MKLLMINIHGKFLSNDLHSRHDIYRSMQIIYRIEY